MSASSKGFGELPGNTIIVPIGDGSPYTEDEQADLAELRAHRRLSRSGWLRVLIDAEPENPSRAKVFEALQSHMQSLVMSEHRDFSLERRAIIVAYDALRSRTTRVATGEVEVGRMWLWLRSAEAYAGEYNRLVPGTLIPRVTGASGNCQFAFGRELGYEDENADRWFVIFPLIAGGERLDMPLDQISYVREALAEGFVEVSGLAVTGLRSLIRHSS